MNDYVRNKVKWENKIFNSFVRNDCKKLQGAINLISEEEKWLQWTASF